MSLKTLTNPAMLTLQSILQRLASKLLPIIMLLTIIGGSVTQSALANTVLSADNIDVVDVVDASVDGNIKPAPAVSASSIDSNIAIRQKLTQIVTSEAYATSQEIKSWQPIEQPDSEEDLGWLETLLKYIFSHDATSQNSSFSIVLKALFIGALILFIIWVFKRAGYLSGWVERMNKSSRRQSTLHRRLEDYQQQGWESLPTHEQIPTVVEQYIAEGKIIQAASTFYRGSLRWLVSTQQLSIEPASTENQCLAQIQQLAQFNNSEPHRYIIQLINLWIQIAYDKQQRVQHPEYLIRQLQANADNWLQQLPLSSSSHSHVVTGRADADYADKPKQGGRQ